MRQPSIRFNDIAREIQRVTSRREQLVLDAFDALELGHKLLAQTLLNSMGSRRRAAHWMCTHYRAFEGRSAYDVLADGDEELIWDQFSSTGMDEATNGARAHMA